MSAEGPVTGADLGGLPVRYYPPGEPAAVPRGWVLLDLPDIGGQGTTTYDPARVGVVRVVHSGPLSDDVRAWFESRPWMRVVTEPDGAELWALDRARAAEARLDHLAATPPPGLGLGIE